MLVQDTAKNAGVFFMRHSVHVVPSCKVLGAFCYFDTENYES